MVTKPTIEEFRKLSTEKKVSYFEEYAYDVKHLLNSDEIAELIDNGVYFGRFDYSQLVGAIVAKPNLINVVGNYQNLKSAIIHNLHPELIKYLPTDEQAQMVAEESRFFPYLSEEALKQCASILNNVSEEELFNYAEKNPKIISFLSANSNRKKENIRQDVIEKFKNKSPERLLELDDIPPIPYDKLLDILKEHPEKAKYLEKQSNDSLVMKGLFSACYMEEYKSTYKRILPYLSVDAQKLLININNNLYNSASENVKADDDFRYKLVKSDFRNAKLLSAEEREQPEFASCVERMHTLEDFREGRIKLDDIDKNMFADIKFYNSIVKTAKDKIIERFNEVTKDANLTDKFETKLEEKMLTKIKKLEKKLSMQRKLTMLKNGIMKKLNISKSNHDLMKQVDSIEV